MKKILLFAGTTEGRLLTEFLIKRPVSLHVCVATDYGRSLLPSAANLTVSSQRMNSEEMTAFMMQEHFDLVLDATHPYASDVTKNIQISCEQTNIPYQRILRDCHSTVKSSPAMASFDAALSDLSVENIESAVEYLKSTKGPVFLTTGSKNLPDFMSLPDAASRLFVRVLPNADIVTVCGQFGLKGAHIICMQGPFDTAMNLATINHIRRQWQKENPENADAPMHMVTKQSGQAGGFDEKLEAAVSAGIHLLIIGQPEKESGMLLSDAYGWLDSWCGCQHAEHSIITGAARTVSLIGMGMSARQLTLEADAALRSCDVIIGAKRMLEMTADYHKPTYCSYNYPAIADYMMSHWEYRHFAVLFSGDIGFYSGAAGMRRALFGLPFKIQTFSGIASPIHFLNTIGKPWENVHLISCHGQKTHMASQVRSHEKILALLGKPNDAADICQQLIAHHLTGVNVFIGCNLQQADELILNGRPEDFINRTLPALSVIYIENPHAGDWPVTHGMPDTSFHRGKVPMTKSEIRSIVLSKLSLTDKAVLYDIGAGTGSIAIEAARQIPNGFVYAIEKNPEGIELIQTNSRQLQADNLTILEGLAPECMKELPPATHAFIGGSSGQLGDILRLLYEKNPKMHIVITAITLETIGEVIRLQKEMTLPEPEIIQVQVSATKKAGPYHLIQGQNPVYIITF